MTMDVKKLRQIVTDKKRKIRIRKKLAGVGDASLEKDSSGRKERATFLLLTIFTSAIGGQFFYVGYKKCGICALLAFLINRVPFYYLSTIYVDHSPSLMAMLLPISSLIGMGLLLFSLCMWVSADEKLFKPGEPRRIALDVIFAIVCFPICLIISFVLGGFCSIFLGVFG